MKLGTLRVVYVHAWDEIGASDYKQDYATCREGDKLEFALDGMIVNFDKKEDAALLDSQVTIDFSIITAEKEEVLLSGFPYSCRGTRNNPKYIPLSKETGFPHVPAGKKFYYKITNNNDTFKILGVAIAVFGYPVIGD